MKVWIILVGQSRQTKVIACLQDNAWNLKGMQERLSIGNVIERQLANATEDEQTFTAYSTHSKFI